MFITQCPICDTIECNQKIGKYEKYPMTDKVLDGRWLCELSESEITELDKIYERVVIDYEQVIVDGWNLHE